MNKFLNILFTSFLIFSCNKNDFKIDRNEINKGIVYEVNVRQYSKEGSFKAVTNDIPKIKDLGVEILWLMPIHPIGKEKRKGGLGSYYSISDYKGINREFGNKEDLKDLVRVAHENNMIVIMDWVANHTAWDHSWIKNNPDFYTKNSDGEITDPINPYTGESWGWTDVADLNFDSSEMRIEMIDAMKYWIEEFNIDGYRCDAAHSCPVDFWKESINELRKIKNVFMLAESDPFNVGGFELINSFEMSYNWQGHHILNEISKGHKTAKDLKENIQRNLDIYEDNHILLNFTSNHDENTWVGTVFDRMGESYLTMSVLTYVIPGIPLLYNGQEYSLNKRLEFFEKDFIPKENKELVEFYTSLGQIKRNNKALHFSKDTKFNLKDTNDNNVLIFERSLENQTILFISNLSDESKEISHDINGDYRNLISGEITNFNSIEKLNFKSWDYLLLEKL
jgi:alpha-amylase